MNKETSKNKMKWWHYLIIIIIASSLGIYKSKEMVRAFFEGARMSSTTTTQDERQSKPEEKSEILKVKGLYIGMNIEDAAKQLGSLLKTDQVTINETPKDFFIGKRDAYYQDIVSAWYIAAGLDKKVTYIKLRSDFVDTLFKTEGISGQKFTQTFIDSYHIPRMEGFGNGWTYTSPNGYKIKIYQDKSILIESVAKETDFKFD